MATAFHVSLITPERSLFDGDAEEVSMRTEIGEIAFLAHHEDFIGAAGVTAVRITTTSEESSDGDGSAVRAAVDGGTVHVHPDGLVILAPVAELAGDIDVERARRALERAEHRLASLGERQEGRAEDEDAEGEGAATEAAQRRARARLEAAGADTSA